MFKWFWTIFSLGSPDNYLHASQKNFIEELFPTTTWVAYSTIIWGYEKIKPDYRTKQARS